MRGIDGAETNVHRVFRAFERNAAQFGPVAAIILIQRLGQRTLPAEALFLGPGSSRIKAAGDVSIGQVEDDRIIPLLLKFQAQFQAADVCDARQRRFTENGRLRNDKGGVIDHRPFQHGGRVQSDGFARDRLIGPGLEDFTIVPVYVRPRRPGGKRALGCFPEVCVRIPLDCHETKI